MLIQSTNQYNPFCNRKEIREWNYGYPTAKTDFIGAGLNWQAQFRTE